MKKHIFTKGLFSLCVILACGWVSVKGQDVSVKEASLLYEAGAVNAEGSMWIPKSQELYWIDIEKGIFNILNPVNKHNRAYPLGQRVGTFVPEKAGGVLVALQDGIYHLDFKTSKLSFVTKADYDPKISRFNDGKCDPAGRFWVGSMSLNGKKKAAALYCYDSKGKLNKMLDTVSLSNGIVWTADKKTMYFIDTPTMCVQEFDYDNSTGKIKFKRIAVRITGAFSAGHPDGMAIDSKGMLWIAQWDGSCVKCFNPHSGKVLMKIHVPAPRVSSCTFGGKNMDILYITTASQGLTKEELKKYPHSGSIFWVKPGARGVNPNYYQKR